MGESGRSGSRKGGKYAVIGNGPSALCWSLGREIDACDVVVRMNNYEIGPKWHSCIGYKTDVYCCNFYFQEIRKSSVELNDHGVASVWGAIPDVPISHWSASWSAGRTRFSDFHLRKVTLKDFILVANRGIDGWLKYLMLRFLGDNAYKRIRRSRVQIPTTGLVAILLAVQQKPSSILVTGFDFFQKDRRHYFSQAQIPLRTHHHFDSEPKTLGNLIRRHKEVKFLLAMQPELYERYFSSFENCHLIAQHEASDCLPS